MKKLVILMFLFISILSSSENILDESFGKDLKVGLESKKSSKLYIKIYYGDAVLIADGFKKKLDCGAYFEMESRNNYLYAFGRKFKELKLAKKDIISIVGISKNKKDYMKYRGDFSFVISKSKIFPINRIKVEEYLYSVVPSEIGIKFPDEAIKAQAVAARTYLLYSLKSKKYKGFDLLDDTSSQMYLGYNKENKRINNLVNETKGKVIHYNGNPINALYHSTSGGKTVSNEDVWNGQAIPYLRSVDDKDNWKYSPRATWIYKLSKKEISKKFDFKVKKIKILEKAEGRIKKLRVYGSKDITISGNTLRSKLGYNNIFSTVFNLIENGDEYIFKGKGSGHGVGMSQWGAYGLAEKGYTYNEILKYYYTGIKIKDIEKK